MSAPKDDALAAAVAEHGPFPMPVGTADVDPVRGPLWSLLDWSLWGAGLGDTFREPLADAMLGAVPAEMVAQAEAVMAEFIERRRIEKTGVTVYQEQRAEVDRLRAERAQLQDDITGACLARHEEEQENARLRARVAELEAQAEKVAAFCAQRAEYVTNLRAFVEGGEHDYYRWTGHAEARRQLSQSLGLPVGWPAEDKQATAPTSAEDPHDSPLHHSYAVGRDLPEATPDPSRTESVAKLRTLLSRQTGGAL